MQFAKIHIFRYSRRPGTLADKLPSQIPEQVKKERADRLSALEQRMAAQFLQSHVGKTVSILFEREKTPEFHIGHAKDYTTVQVPANPTDGSFRNRVCDVHIAGVENGKLIGVITDELG
jgi:threonylcarbamoyladenosine tRNA methylthiotransferase MtaB